MTGLFVSSAQAGIGKEKRRVPGRAFCSLWGNLAYMWRAMMSSSTCFGGRVRD